MITLYGYKRCSTCRKAEKALSENGIDYNFVDITTQDSNTPCQLFWGGPLYHFRLEKGITDFLKAPLFSPDLL